MAILLNDSVAVTRGPEVVLMVDKAAVGDVRHQFPVAEAAHQISGRIEFQERRRLFRYFSFLVGDITAIHDEDVVLRIDTNTAHLAKHPVVRQRFGPRRIYLKSGRFRLGCT
jgi:hypothetical protein